MWPCLQTAVSQEEAGALPSAISLRKLRKGDLLQWFKEGDQIEIDIPRKKLNLLISDRGAEKETIPVETAQKETEGLPEAVCTARPVR